MEVSNNSSINTHLSPQKNMQTSTTPNPVILIGILKHVLLLTEQSTQPIYFFVFNDASLAVSASTSTVNSSLRSRSPVFSACSLSSFSSNGSTCSCSWRRSSSLSWENDNVFQITIQYLIKRSLWTITKCKLQHNSCLDIILNIGAKRLRQLGWVMMTVSFQVSQYFSWRMNITNKCWLCLFMFNTNTAQSCWTCHHALPQS